MASSSTTINKRKIKLRSSDGKIFEVDEAVAMQSDTIRSMIEVIPVSEVTSKTLSLVIDYCTKCLENNTCNNNHIYEEIKDDHSLRNWAFNLFQVDQPAFFDLILAAHYLKIKSLENLTSQIFGEVIRGKTLEEITQTFNINKPSTFAEN
ncbi:hypothetical protein RND81_05G082900 [Saponaria officinalis]|uniref:SKP1-like protein n=1 Tax=Saponaria officinalis TaxID=3572 RepID=A0AAW1KVC0_SAPOF